MEAPEHSLNNLFKQLGLASSNNDIQAFVELHQPLPLATRLSKADFWTPSQATFLADAIAEDADWAKVVEDLDEMLRR